MKGDDDWKRRKEKKKGESVPFRQLGFKAKIYIGIQTQYRRQRTRYKAVKYGSENSKECFMERLKFVVNHAQLNTEELKTLSAFKGIKRQEWIKVRQIVFHSKEELYCAICLETNFQVPQITSCGHVFCWHCILMHFYKSLRARFCPVCNENYELDTVVSCLPLNTKNLREEGTKVTFHLKARREGDNRVYDPDTLEEDLTFARVARATPEKILQLFIEERRQIQVNIRYCTDEDIKSWMEKIYSLAWQRVERAQAIASRYESSSNNRISDGFLYSSLDQKERTNLTTFYQQKNGHLLFLHPICDNYLRKAVKIIPRQIEEETIYWQQAEYNVELVKKYKQISHITINQEVDLLIVNIESQLDALNLTGFEDDIRKFKERKRDQMARQDRESERLQLQYEQQKEYMAKLKKLEESEFYDIRLPTTIDASQINNTAYFPSLMETQSMPDPSVDNSQGSPKQKQKKKKVKLEEGDFPDLLIKKESQPLVDQADNSPPLFSAKSEQVTLSVTPNSEKDDFPDLSTNSKDKSNQNQGGKRNKKKQKFVNVTEMFFKQEDEDEEGYY